MQGHPDSFPNLGIFCFGIQNPWLWIPLPGQGLQSPESRFHWQGIQIHTIESRIPDCLGLPDTGAGGLWGGGGFKGVTSLLNGHKHVRKRIIIYFFIYISFHIVAERQYITTCHTIIVLPKCEYFLKYILPSAWTLYNTYIMYSDTAMHLKIMYMLWFNFILGLNFISLCLGYGNVW